MTASVERARRSEGLRTARLFNRFRFVGVSVFFAFAGLVEGVLGTPGWTVD